MENSRNKQFLSLQLSTVLSSMIQSHAVHSVLPIVSFLCPTKPYDTLYIFPIISHLIASGYQIDCRGVSVLMCKLPLFYLITTPKQKTVILAGHSDVPRRSHNVHICTGNNTVYDSIHIGFHTIHSFRHLLGVLELLPKVMRDNCALHY